MFLYILALYIYMPVEGGKNHIFKKSIYFFGEMGMPLGREVSVIMSKVQSRFLKE